MARSILSPQPKATLAPSADQLRFFPFGHGRVLAVVRRDLCDDLAGFGLARHDARIATVAFAEQGRVTRHDKASLRLGGLMAALAILLEDSADIPIVAHFV